MADLPLSSIGLTSTTTSGYVHIILPDGSSPTGYTSYRISITDLESYLKGQIDNNTTALLGINTRLLVVEEINSREKFTSETSAFEYSQAADSTVLRMTFNCPASGTNTIKVGTSLGASDIMSEKTLNNDVDTPYVFDQPLYMSTARTLYFTPGGTVSASVYATLNDY